MGKEEAFKIQIGAASDQYDPSDDRWIEQVNQLYSDLQYEVGDIEKEVTPVEGKKGGWESVVMTIGSSGLLNTAVDVFSAWLSRDKTRKLALTVKKGDQEEVIEISGAGFDKKTMLDLMSKAIEKRD